ncbi:hypothetical protein LUZ60_012400 [Juncus effusus]|nr:hypothetical protein LUZ60_012400 [Juncus effusus]
MSVVGFDVGNSTCTIAVARQRGVDIVLNNESNRETPSVVSFDAKQRYIGIGSSTNPTNTVSHIKRLLGKKYSEIKEDVEKLPFKVTEGPDGCPLVQVSYLGDERKFTPTQLYAMVLANLKGIAEKNLNSAVVDCCIGIPVYFTDLQRRAVKDAAKIAGLHPLHLFHETTATALAYGIYKTDLPEKDPVNVAFVDFGHSSMQVCIASFKKGQLNILAHSSDSSLGGRDFDEVLFTHFAEKFKSEYKIDVIKNPRACARLRAGCEKLKKTLSANPEAPMNIECLMDEKDVRGFLKRDEFEQLSKPILERVLNPLTKALEESKLTLEEIDSVEVVGSGSRVPAIVEILRGFFGKEPRRTVNASECVARGCVLQCAVLSPTFKVREFQVKESFPYSIGFSWMKPADSSNETESQQSSIIFPKGTEFPSSKIMTIYRSSTFSLDAIYADISEPPKISSYTIGPFQTKNGEKAKVQVRARLDLHGIVSIDSATLLEEEEIEVPVSAEQENSKMEIDEATNNSNETNTKENSNSDGTENGAVPESKETNAKANSGPKPKVKKISVPVTEIVNGGLTKEDLEKAVEKEFEMALQDRIVEETKDKKNAVEAYIYDMRSKLSDKYQEFVLEREREEFVAQLQETEDWLYEEGEDESKGVYISKLDELKKRGDPIESRHKEWTERGPTMQQLMYCIQSFRNAAMSNDARFDHIDQADKQKVVTACTEAENWLRERNFHQDSLPKHTAPILLCADVRKKAETLDRFCKPIMTRPKPAPKPQTPPPTEPPAQQTDQAPAGEPMDVEKPEESVETVD